MTQFIETHKGGKALLYCGYKYHKIREGKDKKVFEDVSCTDLVARGESLLLERVLKSSALTTVTHLQ